MSYSKRTGETHVVNALTAYAAKHALLFGFRAIVLFLEAYSFIQILMAYSFYLPQRCSLMSENLQLESDLIDWRKIRSGFQ